MSDADAATFLQLARAGGQAPACRYVLALLRDGVDPRVVVREVLVPAQRSVGDDWAAGRVGVAAEHAMSAVSDAALAALALTVPPDRLHRARLVVVCAEGEWHTLPARMAAELLRWEGCDVTFLGPSLPAAHLAALLRRERPDALVVTVALGRHLTGLHRTVQAAVAEQIPAFAGGSGLDDRPGWADRLGAVWASEPAEVLDLLRTRPGAARQVEVSPEAALLAAHSQDLEEAAVELLLGRSPHSDDQSRVAALRAVVEHLLAVLAAAVLVEDPAVLARDVDWLASSTPIDGVPERTGEALRAVRLSLAGDFPEAEAIVERVPVPLPDGA